MTPQPDTRRLEDCEEKRVAAEAERDDWEEQCAALSERAERVQTALEAAKRFEREFQRQKGAVLNPEDHWRLDRYQHEFLEALSAGDKP